MSILASQTNFLLSNTTSHFLEITISAEQDEEFRMMRQTSVRHAGANDRLRATGLFVGHGESNGHLYWSKLQIKINLPAKTQFPMRIRCTSTLSFNTNIKSTQCTDIISGFRFRSGIPR